MGPESNQIAAIVLLAFMVRLHRLGVHGFHWDELTVLFNAMKPFSSFDTIACSPVFSSLVRILYLLTGKEEALRLLPLLVGTAMIPVAYAVFRRWANHAAGLWGAGIIALSPLHVYYSQELTVYGLVALEALLAVFLWDRLFEGESLTDVFWYALVMIAGLWSHPWFFFVFLAHVLWLFFFCRADDLFLKAFIGLLAVVAGSWPWWSEFLPRFHAPYFLSLGEPSFAEVARTFQTFLFGIAPSLGSWRTMGFQGNLAVTVFSVLALAGGLAAAGGRWPRRLRILFVGFLGPLALGFSFSYFVTPVYIPDNCTLIAFPAFVGILCLNFAAPSRWQRRTAKVLGASYLVLSAGLLVFCSGPFEKSAWGEMGDFIASVPRPRAVDMRALNPPDRRALAYYARDARECRGMDRFGRLKGAENIPRLFIPVPAGQAGSAWENLPEPWRVTRVRPVGDFRIILAEREGESR